MFQAVLEALQTAKEPMTARQVTEAVLRARRIADPDKAEVRRLIATVQTCLATAAKTVHQVGEGISSRPRWNSGAH